MRRHRLRGACLAAIADLDVGVRSLGELDVAGAMRRRGLPEPERQSLRRRPSGTEYFDADFPAYGVSLEVDGVQHAEPWQQLADLVRDTRPGAEGRTTVRISLVAWRLDQERVLDALEERFTARARRRQAV